VDSSCRHRHCCIFAIRFERARIFEIPVETLENLISKGISEEIGVPKVVVYFSSTLLFERRERVLLVKSREKINYAAAYSELDYSFPESAASGVSPRAFVILNVRL